MSVHVYTLQVAGELRRRLDVDGLERVRRAQLDYQRDRLEAETLRHRRRRRALRAAEDKFRRTVANAFTTNKSQQED